MKRPTWRDVAVVLRLVLFGEFLYEDGEAKSDTEEPKVAVKDTISKAMKERGTQ